VKPDWRKQAAAGVAVLFVIAVTIAGGVLLAVSESPAELADRPTATPYRIPTLIVLGTRTTPAGEDEPPTVDTELPPPAVVITLTPASSGAVPTGTLPPTVTPTALPTSTSVPTSTRIPATASSSACRVRADWVPYTVQAGETLYGIGLRYGVRVDTLADGNCLDSTYVVAGQALRVPDVPPSVSGPASTGLPTATAIPQAGATPTSTGTDGACSSPGSQITAPPVGSVLSGVARFYGTASHPNLSIYKLEIRREDITPRPGWVTAVTGSSSVTGGPLGEIDTHAFENGQYWVRLVVVDNTGNYPEPCSILYTFTN
jgi:LysM repeat protein